MKILFLQILLCITLQSFSQVTHEDSLRYLDHLRADSLMGLDARGKTLKAFIAKDRKGTIFTNDSLRSKITFINFWFETCAPCAAEFQALEKFYTNNKSRRGFQFVSITYEADTVIERIRMKNNLTYPMYHLSYDSCRKVLINLGYPTSQIIDKTGKIVYSVTGGPLDPVMADKYLNYFIQAELDKQLKNW
ncbi:MAG TPA: TlpA disulfide reductase family protein [Chitinophagaceae bacterium]|jgi:thiol-disulfide isomerase/thioredoxin|nr:TlpA disulfide reductase family protein [Chitinophagaceae bacterium]